MMDFYILVQYYGQARTGGERAEALRGSKARIGESRSALSLEAKRGGKS